MAWLQSEFYVSLCYCEVHFSPVIHILFNYVEVYLKNFHINGTKVTQENTRAKYINKGQQR